MFREETLWIRSGAYNSSFLITLIFALTWFSPKYEIIVLSFLWVTLGILMRFKFDFILTRICVLISLDTFRLNSLLQAFDRK